MHNFKMWYNIIPLASLVLLAHAGPTSKPHRIPTPSVDSEIVANDLQSFSIEFAFFPDYAGNSSQPNEFSKNLLSNFGDITGVLPKVRVGGTSQDHATYVADQKENVQLIFANPDDDQPDRINYGPSYFESYHTLGKIQFVHGLNMNQNKSTKQLQDSAVVACTSIGPQLELFELGNEFDFAPGSYRSTNYSLSDYVDEWNGKSASVQSAVNDACTPASFGFMAPSFILGDVVNTTWTVEEMYRLGYDPKNLTKEISIHNYLGVFSPPLGPVSVDLQSILMNHTNIVNNLAPHIQRMKNIAYIGHPYTLGETNSIANQGRNGETNVFGDALWLVDYSLWAAAHNIKRIRFHQGLNYRYASWLPIPSKGVQPTTRPPYYGHIMVASAIGQAEDVRVVNVPLGRDTEAAYGIYQGDKLAKLVVLNLEAFNQTAQSPRNIREYRFRVPGAKSAKVERLTAPGSDSTGNITFGGVSYDYSLARGRPTHLNSTKETVAVRDGLLRAKVPASEAILYTFL